MYSIAERVGEQFPNAFCELVGLHNEKPVNLPPVLGRDAEIDVTLRLISIPCFNVQTLRTTS